MGSGKLLEGDSELTADELLVIERRGLSHEGRINVQ